MNELVRYTKQHMVSQPKPGEGEELHLRPKAAKAAGRTRILHLRPRAKAAGRTRTLHPVTAAKARRAAAW